MAKYRLNPFTGRLDYNSEAEDFSDTYYDKDETDVLLDDKLDKDGANADETIDINAENLTTTGDINCDDLTATGDVLIGLADASARKIIELYQGPSGVAGDKVSIYADSGDLNLRNNITDRGFVLTPADDRLTGLKIQEEASPFGSVRWWFDGSAVGGGTGGWMESTIDMNIKLGDNAGANKFNILNLDEDTVSDVDSEGKATFINAVVSRTNAETITNPDPIILSESDTDLTGVNELFGALINTKIENSFDGEGIGTGNPTMSGLVVSNITTGAVPNGASNFHAVGANIVGLAVNYTAGNGDTVFSDIYGAKIKGCDSIFDNTTGTTVYGLEITPVAGFANGTTAVNDFNTVGLYIKAVGTTAANGGTAGGNVNYQVLLDGTGTATGSGIWFGGTGGVRVYPSTTSQLDIDGDLNVNGTIAMQEVSSDPTDPIEGKSVFWQSDGSATGDDGDLLYKEQSGAVIEQGSLKWKDFQASSSTLTTGTDISGDYTDTQVMYSGTPWIVAETAGAAPNLDCRLNFTNVDRYPTMVVARWEYNGGAGHIQTIEIYNYTSVGWDILRSFTDDNGYGNSMTMYLPQNIQNDYVDGSGNAVVRFYHQSSGVSAHRLEIDYVGLTHSLQGVI